MRKYTVYMLLIAFLTPLVFISSCNRFEDLDTLETGGLNAEYAVPLFSSEIRLQDVLENFDEETFITLDPDGLIKLNYKGDVRSRTSTDIFTGLPQGPFPVLDTFMAVPFMLPPDFDVDYTILKNGKIFYNMQSLHEEDVEVTVSIPQATLNGEVLTFVKNLDYTGTVPVVLSDSIDLTGYRLDFGQDTIFIRYKLIKENGEQDKLSLFIMNLQQLEFSYAQGYFGSEVYEIERDTIEIEFFENWTRGDVYFEDPKILINVHNSFGFPVRSIANIVDIHSVDGSVLPLESEFINVGIDFDYPSLSEVGQTKVTPFAFNKDNSNIVEVLSSGPVAVDYDFDARGNPDMDTSITGFITDSSEFRVAVEVELPVYGTAKGFEVQDTFGFSGFDDYDNVDFAEFKIVADNGIPLDVFMQMYFADENGVVLDSLLMGEEKVVEAAPVDASGIVIQPREKITFALLPEEKFDSVKKTRQIQFKAAFSTLNDGNTSVKVFAHQTLGVRIGAILGISE